VLPSSAAGRLSRCRFSLKDYKLKLRNLRIPSHIHWVVRGTGQTRLTYTGLFVGLEHLKIETRLIDEKIVNVLGEYVT